MRPGTGTSVGLCKGVPFPTHRVTAMKQMISYYGKIEPEDPL